MSQDVGSGDRSRSRKIVGFSSEVWVIREQDRPKTLMWVCYSVVSSERSRQVHDCCDSHGVSSFRSWGTPHVTGTVETSKEVQGKVSRMDRRPGV